MRLVKDAVEIQSACLEPLGRKVFRNEVLRPQNHSLLLNDIVQRLYCAGSGSFREGFPAPRSATLVRWIINGCAIKVLVWLVGDKIKSANDPQELDGKFHRRCFGSALVTPLDPPVVPEN